MLGPLGTPEILLILVVVVLLFGAKRLPDTARALGKSMRIFKSETRAMRDDEDVKPSVSPEPPRSLDPAPPRTSETRPVNETNNADR